jgi:hypothetical protein
VGSSLQLHLLAFVTSSLMVLLHSQWVKKQDFTNIVFLEHNKGKDAERHYFHPSKVTDAIKSCYVCYTTFISFLIS